MGMDVFGRKPTTEEGKYFRNSVWSWRPLADYIIEVAPTPAHKLGKGWHYNDGKGLNKADSLKLADILEAEIKSGRTERYARVRASEIERLPDDPCQLCEGTGTRKPVPQMGAGDPKTDGIVCNACDGRGHVRPWADSYPFNVENVQRFATFLRGCGGFKIC